MEPEGGSPQPQEPSPNLQERENSQSSEPQWQQDHMIRVPKLEMHLAYGCNLRCERRLR